MLQIIKKISISIIFTMSVILMSPQIMAVDNIVNETQTHNVFKGFLLNIWGKFKSFNPHNKQVAKANTVYTAGIRGAESTGTLLQPYWKDDLTQDPAFQKELKLYGEALTSLDNGNLKQANASLSAFLESYPKSILRPNALFAQGMSYAGLGDTTNASKSLEQFVKAYSSHPLAEDAESILKQFK